jgi:hypothetical protein
MQGLTIRTSWVPACWLASTTSGAFLHLHHLATLRGLLLWQMETSNGSLYSILWILVFAFATLNIISLGARRLEPKKTSLNIGEMMAVLVVLFSVFLLGWELLHLYHIFPIHLGSR